MQISKAMTKFLTTSVRIWVGNWIPGNTSQNNVFLVKSCVVLWGVSLCHVLRVLVIRLFRIGQVSDFPYDGTSRGLVRFSCDKCNYKVSHCYAFAVS